ncbi:MAG: hypothetical protein J6K85_02865 [Clostridia bacterium]|nr:hypothetical protein [Clostridia bacterium]
MAERRMISKRVILTDKFSKMTDKAKLLYINLMLEADDDGFVFNPRAVMGMCGANIKSFLQLIERDYVLSFNSGAVVITHWNMQNRIEKRKRTPTIYREELESLILDENGVYQYR